MLKRKQAGFIAVIALLCLATTACKVTAVDAATAVNKYGVALQGFHDVEQTLHEQKKADGTAVIGDALHFQIIGVEKTAVQAGKALDAAITVAASGGDVADYISAAQKGYDDLVTTVKIDPKTEQALSLSIHVAGDALKNAITVLNALRNGTPAPAPTTSHNTGLNLALWVTFLLPMGMAASGGGLQGLITAQNIVQLLQLVVAIEPAAFDLVMKLATSLKGKSTEEILAMNESIFSKLEAELEAEEAKKPV